MRVVAEAGVNFKDLEEAIEMINESKRLGLWATKFQCYDDEIIKDHPQREFLKSIMIGKDEAMILFEHGREIGQKVFFTPMYEGCLKWLYQYNSGIYKIRYLDQSNLELINMIFIDKELFKPNWFTCLISTDFPKFYSTLNFFPLYCIPKYPATFEDYKWIMRKLEDTYYSGISDHTPDLKMMEYFLKWEKKDIYRGEIFFEKHVCLTKECLEAEWSVTFKELEEVLK